MLVNNAGTGSDVVAAMSYGSDVVAIEPNEQMFEVLVARVRAFAASMESESRGHVYVRQAWVDYFVEEPRRKAEEALAMKQQCEAVVRENRKLVRKMKRQQKKETEEIVVKATVDESGETVAEHTETVEKLVVEEEDNGTVEVAEFEGAFSAADMMSTVNLDDAEEADGAGWAAASAENAANESLTNTIA